VEAVEDGAAAWDALQANHYDLLITDNEMPRMSGCTLIELIHTAQMSLPVIMSSAILPTAEFIRRPWLKPAATLLKPYRLEEFLNTVRNVLRAHSSVEEQSNNIWTK
jgi:DNA-binding response OmpR family regulator